LDLPPPLVPDDLHLDGGVRLGRVLDLLNHPRRGERDRGGTWRLP
jgi:hypothetical protein